MVDGKAKETREYKPKDLLTVHEIASLLMVAEKTVYRYLTQGKLPGVRFGGAVRVQYGALMDFISGKMPEKSTGHVTNTPSQDSGLETMAYQVEEAAVMLHVDSASISEAVGNGQLYAIRIGTETVIPKSELEQLVEVPAKINDFTRQLLMQKGLISKGYPFDNSKSGRKDKKEISAIIGYVASRVAEIRSGYSFGLHTSLDEIFMRVRAEVMEGKYASQQAAPRRGRR